MTILVTGAAGFIGYHVTERLLARGDQVLGLDNLNDYYDVRLKHARLERLESQTGFRFVRMDLADRDGIARLFGEERPTRVVHLAAQAGVRYSIDHPHAYVDSNLVGFVNVLEGCRHTSVEHLVYASSSSVYGANTKLPFSVGDNVDHPVSLYAATKKANELMAHTYSHLYSMPTTGLRFFTVYGSWGRPDMAYWKFTDAIMGGRPIEIFNHGRMQRDFTYIDDVVEGVIRVLDTTPEPGSVQQENHPNPGASAAPYRLYNVGNHQPVDLLRFIETIEDRIGARAEKRFLPMQPGDVPATYANVDSLSQAIGFTPKTPIEVGITHFVRWYREYYAC